MINYLVTYEKRNLLITNTKLLESIFGSKNFEKETLNYSKDDEMSKGIFDI